MVVLGNFIYNRRMLLNVVEVSIIAHKGLVLSWIGYTGYSDILIVTFRPKSVGAHKIH